MNKQIICIFVLIYCIATNTSFAQETDLEPTGAVSKLFTSHEPIKVKLNYSNRDIKRKTNDSTYIPTKLVWQETEGKWDSLDVEIRARGFFRLNNCYFAPIKLSIKKSVSKGTLFEGNKKLKIVLPCLIQKDNNDNVIREYMAYRLYEIISPYHFNTRLMDLSYEEERGNKNKSFELKGFLIEDDKNVAKRHKGKVVERFIHPLAQDTITSVRNAFFQFMIGNTDFSVGYQHNEKLLYIDKKIMPVPYDFDMAGLVNTSYARVSVIQGEELPIQSVTERKYRGFKRDIKYLDQVRKEFVANKDRLMEIVDECEPFFEDPREFKQSRDYISEFFDVMVNDSKFEYSIVRQARAH